ncbi:MAG: LysR family transcriptional regulator, partial [Synergistaceae bacterium]|nr:LysR family transcriptional regulator [Synergistaceae bacterium]
MQTLNPDYFLKIVECGSLTKAAEELIVSQPSLSQYIRRLERSLDAKLFDRKSSPMKLTYTG